MSTTDIKDTLLDLYERRAQDSKSAAYYDGYIDMLGSQWDLRQRRLYRRRQRASEDAETGLGKLMSTPARLGRRLGEDFADDPLNTGTTILWENAKPGVLKDIDAFQRDVHLLEDSAAAFRGDVNAANRAAEGWSQASWSAATLALTLKGASAPNQGIEFKRGARGVAGKQAVIENVIEGDLGGIDFTARPLFVPGLAAFGRSTGGGNPTIQIGGRSMASRLELRDTLLHEEMHHRLWKRGVASPHDHGYIQRVVDRFFSMKGW